MAENKLIQATKDSFAQFNDGLITRAELNAQLKRIGVKWDGKSVLDVFLDKLDKEMKRL